MAYTFAEIEEKARATIALAKAEGIVPVPLERIAASLGFEAVSFDGRDDISGAIDHATNRIFINRGESLVRQRFTLAHEIGHAVLHPSEDMVDFRKNLSVPNDPKERDANKFASEILMPTDLFRKAWKERAGSVSRVAAYFSVSTEAAGFRAKNLGLIP